MPSCVHILLPHGDKIFPMCTMFRHMCTISSLSPRCLATWMYAKSSLCARCLATWMYTKSSLCARCLATWIQNRPCVHGVLPHGYKIVPVCTISCHMDTKSSLCARCLATWRRNLHFSIHGESVDGWMGDRYVHGFAPTPRSLRSRILCRLHQRLSDETTNRGPCMSKDLLCTLTIL